MTSLDVGRRQVRIPQQIERQSLEFFHGCLESAFLTRENKLKWMSNLRKCQIYAFYNDLLVDEVKTKRKSGRFNLKIRIGLLRLIKITITNQEKKN